MAQPLEANRFRIQHEAAQWESYGAILQDHGVPFTSLADIQLAYNFAQEAHRGQLRASGEPYFSHPRAVSLILLEAGVTDPDVHIVALLHDVPEDNFALIAQAAAKLPYDAATTDALERVGRALFDSKITEMLWTLTEPSEDEYDYETDKRIGKEELYYEQLQLALSGRNPEVLLVKMADRLHNLQTLRAMPPDKQRNKINETETIYYPLFEGGARKFPHSGRDLFNEIKSTIDALKK